MAFSGSVLLQGRSELCSKMGTLVFRGPLPIHKAMGTVLQAFFSECFAGCYVDLPLRVAL